MTVDRLVLPEVSALTLDSIFPAPGRNDRCHCGSGKKYKTCCLASDQEAWRAVARKTRQAEAACALLRDLPSTEPTFEPGYLE